MGMVKCLLQYCSWGRCCCRQTSLHRILNTPSCIALHNS